MNQDLSKSIESTPKRRFFPVIAIVSVVHVAFLAAAALMAPPPEEKDQAVKVDVVQMRADSPDTFTLGGSKVSALVSYKKLRANGLIAQGN